MRTKEYQLVIIAWIGFVIFLWVVSFIFRAIEGI